MLECSYRSSYSCKSYSCASWSCNLYIAYGSQDCPLQLYISNPIAIRMGLRRLMCRPTYSCTVFHFSAFSGPAPRVCAPPRAPGRGRPRRGPSRSAVKFSFVELCPRAAQWCSCTLLSSHQHHAIYTARYTYHGIQVPPHPPHTPTCWQRRRCRLSSLHDRELRGKVGYIVVSCVAVASVRTGRG